MRQNRTCRGGRASARPRGSGSKAARQSGGTASDGIGVMAGTIETVGVVGAGQMGGGIAHVAALAGYKVLLNDISPDRIEKGLATISGNMARMVSHGKLDEQHRQEALSRISAAPSMAEPRRRRPRHRGGDRGRVRQAQDLCAALSAAESGGDPRHQHLVDLDHPAGLADRPARAVHRHPFHESGAGDEAGRAGARHRHRGPDLRGGQGLRPHARQDDHRVARTFRPSSSTASCCR